MNVRIDQGRGGRSHRLQRRRQNDLHQHGDRLPATLPAATSCSTARSIIGHAPREITRRGMARSFQVAQLFPATDRAREHADLRSLPLSLALPSCAAHRSIRPIVASVRWRSLERLRRSSRYRDARGQRRAPGRAQARRHRDGAGQQAAHVAARRADQRRQRRGEVATDGHRDGRGAQARRDGACSSSTTWKSLHAT